MLFLNFLSSEMHVLSRILGLGRRQLDASLLRPSGRAGGRLCSACGGPEPSIQRCLMEIDFSYLSPEMMNCFKLE